MFNSTGRGVHSGPEYPKELESWLNDVLAKYKDLVITEDQCKGIKAELAELNKIKANINEAAKGAIAVLSAPLDAFRKKIGSLTKKIDETYRELKDQVDAFAEEERKKKEDVVVQMIDNIKAEYRSGGSRSANSSVVVKRQRVSNSRSAIPDQTSLACQFSKASELSRKKQKRLLSK